MLNMYLFIATVPFSFVLFFDLNVSGELWATFINI